MKRIKKVGLFFMLAGMMPLLVQAEEGAVSKDIGATIMNEPDALPPTTEDFTEKTIILPPEETNPINFSLKLTSGIVAHRFKSETITPGDTVAASQEDNMPFIGFGAALGWNKWSADIYVQRTSKGQSQEFLPQSGGGLEFSDLSFKFTDFSGGIGYELFDGFIISAGYKQSILSNYTRSDLSTATRLPQLAGMTEFKTSGPSLGLSYTLPLNEDMTITAGVSYGLLSGKRSFYEPGTKTSQQDTGGISGGLHFSHRIRRTPLRYTIGADYYNYTIDGKEETSAADLKVDQSLLTFKVSLFYDFSF